MRKLIATNIKWDIDGNEALNLPKTMEIPDGITNEEDISDYLTEQIGYCHNGFTLTYI